MAINRNMDAIKYYSAIKETNYKDIQNMDELTIG